MHMTVYLFRSVFLTVINKYQHKSVFKIYILYVLFSTQLFFKSVSKAFMFFHSSIHMDSVIWLLRYVFSPVFTKRRKSCSSHRSVCSSVIQNESTAYLAGPETGAVYFSSNDPIHNGDVYSSLCCSLMRE